MRIQLRPSVPADLVALGIDKLPHRVKALTALDPAGTPIGIGGICFLPDGSAWATLLIPGEGRRYAAALLRAARRVLAEARRDGLRIVYATADPAIAGSERFLARLGFADAGGGVWVLTQ